MVAPACIFPGQGSQFVGMGKELATEFGSARRTFEEADDVLGSSISKLCWEGPEEDLRLTANTQPAIVTMSIAVWRVLQEEHGLEPGVVAGHSLGEYSALVVAGTLSFEDAVRLVRRRGELMQEAVPVGVGAMAAVLGLEAEAVAEIAAEAAGTEVCAVANFNAPIQTVIAGHTAAVERAVALASERGAKRAVMLPVSAPFHSPLMGPARDGLMPMLEDTTFSDLSVPVIVNVDATPVETGEAARDALVRQIDNPVRWVESVRLMREAFEIERFFEIGPGNVLCGLVRRIDRDAKTLHVDHPSALVGGDAS